MPKGKSRLRVDKRTGAVYKYLQHDYCWCVSLPNGSYFTNFKSQEDVEEWLEGIPGFVGKEQNA